MTARVEQQPLDLSSIEREILRSPFHRWLGIRLDEAEPDGIRLHATWRPEWQVDPETGTTHGGVLASLLDLAADWALVTAFGRGVPTVDLTVHYLRPARVGDLTVLGRLVRPGRLVSTAEAEIIGSDGKTVAVGRGTFLSAVVAGDTTSRRPADRATGHSTTGH